MDSWGRTLVDADIARFVVADSAVGIHATGGQLPENWRQLAATIEANAAEIDDDPEERLLEQWWARGFVARGEHHDAMEAGRGLSPEVSRRFVDPIIAATLAHDDLPAVPLLAAGPDTRPVLHVYGNQAWQTAYSEVVRQVVDAGLNSPEEAGRLLAIGDANWESRDADRQEFESALAAAGASPQETAWLQLAASARPQGWDSILLRQNEALLYKTTAGITPPGATTQSAAPARPSRGAVSGPHARQGNVLGGD